jgi:sugar phosphate isomerase/epimerase
MKNGEVIDEICRPASWYLFDHTLLYPSIGLVAAHLPYSLAQRGAMRIDDAMQIIKDLLGILDDDRFKNSPHTPFSDCRNREKTEKLRAGLAALQDSMVDQAKQLDFTDVFLEDEE